MSVTPLLTLGGSEIAAACGVDPFVSPLTLGARKLGLIPEQEETEAMRLGKRLEPVVAELAAERGYEVMPAPAETLRDRHHNWATGRPDGFTVAHGERAVAELKTVGQLAHREGWNGEPPLHYQAQGQWYMMLTGLRWCVFGVLVGGQRFVTYEIERDNSALGSMLVSGEDFLKLLRRGKLPAPTGTDSDHATIRLLHPEAAQGKVIRADRETWELVKELRARRQQRETVKHQDAELQQLIEAYMGDAEHLISPHDEEVAHFSNVQSRRVDTPAFKAAHPNIAEEFTKVTTTRRFTLT